MSVFYKFDSNRNTPTNINEALSNYSFLKIAALRLG